MNEIPAEVTGMIAKFVTSKTDLENMRLVSKSLLGAATIELFSKQHILLPALIEEPEILENLENIISSSSLARAVRHVKYTTSLEPHKTLDDYNNDEEWTQFSTEMEDAIYLLNKFPNLTHLEIEFSCVCAMISPHDFSRTDPEENHEFRTQVLACIFAALNDAEYPTPNLKSLTIKNLQNVNDEMLVRSEDFANVLKRISELRLQIVTEHDSASPERQWDFPEMHTFMEELPKVWLEPARENLTALTIHMDDYWGYVPKCDLRSVYFPRLKRLELGNWTVTHDWQIDWILSHKDTLEELIMDECPVVRCMENFGQLDAEKYPANPRRCFGSKVAWRYGGRWSEIFRKMKEGLPRLKMLKFGAGQWRDGVNFDGEWRTIGMHENMYMVFDRGLGPSPWLENQDEEDEKFDEETEDDENGDGIDVEHAPRVVDGDEDTAAYLRLMAAIEQRRGAQLTSGDETQ